MLQFYHNELPIHLILINMTKRKNKIIKILHLDVEYEPLILLGFVIVLIGILLFLSAYFKSSDTNRLNQISNIGIAIFTVGFAVMIFIRQLQHKI